jgi:hypothetical protein
MLSGGGRFPRRSAAGLPAYRAARRARVAIAAS